MSFSLDNEIPELSDSRRVRPFRKRRELLLYRAGIHELHRIGQNPDEASLGDIYLAAKKVVMRRWIAAISVLALAASPFVYKKIAEASAEDQAAKDARPELMGKCVRSLIDQAIDGEGEFASAQDLLRPSNGQSLGWVDLSGAVGAVQSIVGYCDDEVVGRDPMIAGSAYEQSQLDPTDERRVAIEIVDGGFQVPNIP